MNNISLNSCSKVLAFFLCFMLMISVSSCAEEANKAVKEKKTTNNVKGSGQAVNKAKAGKAKVTNNKTVAAKKNKGDDKGYWASLINSLKLKDTQVRCLKSAKKAFEVANKDVPVVNGVKDQNARQKLLDIKDTNMKKCIGDKLFAKKNKFDAKWHKDSK